MRELILRKLNLYKEHMGRKDEEPVVPINKYDGPTWAELPGVSDEKLLQVTVMFARLYQINL